MMDSPEQFALLRRIALIWLGLCAGASVIYRIAKSKPIFRPRFEKPRFLETWRSGRSLRSLSSRLGGASHCLWVAIDESSLRVGLHFPFNMMFMPEFYGL